LPPPEEILEFSTSFRGVGVCRGWGGRLPTAILEEEIYQKGKQENPIEYLKGKIRLHKTSK